ncbi:hypothetical protein GCM10023329_18320 [Streptomyces sanyensis]|uniref:Uncharacterized protein n=1 Tax=Streptomyces sanyensis TaxID=568869 RepID=A0ABP9A0F8_9ACTN
MTPAGGEDGAGARPVARRAGRPGGREKPLEPGGGPGYRGSPTPSSHRARRPWKAVFMPRTVPSAPHRTAF